MLSFLSVRGVTSITSTLRCGHKAETIPYSVPVVGNDKPAFTLLPSNFCDMHKRRLRIRSTSNSKPAWSAQPVCKACMNDRKDNGAEGESTSSVNKPLLDEATTTNTTSDSNDNYGPTRLNNQFVAIASVAAAISLFLINRGLGSGPSLSELAASALPYEEAMKNGKPTVVEFYADWCEICREMSRDVYGVKQEYKDFVNFVMLNVDNNKWESELDEFGVEGIPHWAFLDNKGNEEGNVVGRLPRKYLLENVAALARGETKLPHSRIVGKFSSTESSQAPSLVEPRSHGR